MLDDPSHRLKRVTGRALYCEVCFGLPIQHCCYCFSLVGAFLVSAFRLLLAKMLENFRCFAERCSEFMELAGHLKFPKGINGEHEQRFPA